MEGINSYGAETDITSVSVTVVDHDSNGSYPDPAAIGPNGFEIELSKVAPVLANVNVSPDKITENGVVTVSGDIFDPDTRDSFQLVIDWGDGKSPSETLFTGSTGFEGDHTFDAGGNYTIKVSLLDDDLTLATATLDLTVNQVPPALEVNAIPHVVDLLERDVDFRICLGESSVLTGSFTDPGVVSPHTLVADWGDGTSCTYVVAATKSLESGDRVRSDDGSILTVTGVDVKTGAVEFATEHDYDTDGIFNVSVSVHDGRFTVTAELTATVFLFGPTDTTPGVFTNPPERSNLVGVLSIFKSLSDRAMFVGFRADDHTGDAILTEEGSVEFLNDLTLVPFLAGTTQPGATAVITLKDEVGNQIGIKTVIADMAGNWTATFPRIDFDDGDYTLEVQTINPSWNAADGSPVLRMAGFSGQLLGAVRDSSELDADQIIGMAVRTRMLNEVFDNEIRSDVS